MCRNEDAARLRGFFKPMTLYATLCLRRKKTVFRADIFVPAKISCRVQIFVNAKIWRTKHREYCTQLWGIMFLGIVVSYIVAWVMSQMEFFLVVNAVTITPRNSYVGTSFSDQLCLGWYLDNRVVVTAAPVTIWWWWHVPMYVCVHFVSIKILATK